MPGQQRSIDITNAYRDRLFRARQRVEREAARRFPDIAELDTTDYAGRMAVIMRAAQSEVVRATAGYVTAFLTSELGHFSPGPALSSGQYAGKSRDGRPLAEALQSPIVGVKAKLAEGVDSGEAIAYGRNRAVRMVEVDLMHAARASLTDAMDRDERITGWNRAVTGTCGACLGALDEGEQAAGDMIDTHPNCQCVAEPVVRGVPDAVQRLSAAAVFANMTRREQDANFGESTAGALREGAVEFKELKKKVPQALGDDYITQATVAAPSE